MVMWCLSALAAPGEFVEDESLALWVVSEPPGTFGWVTEPIADVDGDGIVDVVTGAPFEGGGELVVLSGADGSVVWRLPSPVPGAQLSYDVSPAGDVDGDGTGDVVAGGPADGPGRVWVVSGRDGTVLHALEGDAEGSRLGEAVCDVDDVDGDGRADFAMGASGADRVTLVSGATGVALVTLDGDPGTRFGAGLASIADLDGDGRRDLVVGAPDAGAGGQVTVWSSSTGTRLLGPLEPGPGGFDLGLWFVGDPGDLDGDGIPDVYAGDFAASGGNGLALVFSGADGSVIHRWEGQDQEGLGVGREAGDVDGDGIGDLAIGSWQHGRGAPGGGRVTVFSGADGSRIQKWTSKEAGENLGFDAVGIGDIDGDGRRDILASGASGNNVYVLSVAAAATTTTPTTTGPATGSAPDDTATAPDDDKGGCGCASTPATPSLVLFPLLWLLARRRT